MVWYGYSFFGLELGSLFPPLAEDLLAPAFFFPSLKTYIIFSTIAITWQDSESVLRGASTFPVFTVDLLKHLWDQVGDLVLDEISNSQLLSSAYIFNSQNWISTRILRVCSMNFEPWTGPKNINLVEDAEIFLPVMFRWILFIGFREEVENVSANQRLEGHLVFPIGPKNTNLVEDFEILHPVKFRWILFSGFREEVENVKSLRTDDRLTVRYDNSSLEPSAQVS